MNYIFNKIIRFFGLKGSWKWACKQMEKGLIVKTKSSTGTVAYRISTDDQRRLQWKFGDESKWENAYYFFRDHEDTDWIIYNE